MSISLQSLKLFLTAAETLNFTKAAELSYMTQPAFSRAIAGLERELGVILFERTTRKITLTPEGQICSRRVRQMLESYSQMNLELEQLQRNAEGHLQIGFTPMSGPPPYFTDAIRQLKKRFPHIRVALRRAPSTELIPEVQEGKLDCALVWSHTARQADHLCCMDLLPTTRYAVVRHEHPLAGKEMVSMKDLVGFSLIFMAEKEKITREVFRKEMMNLGLTMSEEESAVDLSELLMRVSFGDSVAITCFGDKTHHGQDVMFLPIRELNDDGREAPGTHFLIWPDDRENRSCLRFREILKEEIQKEQEE